MTHSCRYYMPSDRDFDDASGLLNDRRGQNHGAILADTSLASPLRR